MLYNSKTEGVEEDMKGYPSILESHVPKKRSILFWASKGKRSEKLHILPISRFLYKNKKIAIV